MKKIFFLIALFSLAPAHAQIVDIPDENFKNKLLYSNYVAYNAAGNQITVDWNHDGQIQVSEALAVTRLNITSSAISSFQGIEAFTNLVEFNCDYNWLSGGLDVSMLPALKKLSCSSCGLSILYVNGLQQLEELLFNNNPLGEIDLTNVPALKVLECTYNQFATINVGSLANLERFNCQGNDLASLDLSNLTNLTELICDGNALTMINTANLPNLKILSLGQNQFTSFDISNLPALETFSINNNPGLTALNLTGAIQLKNLSCPGGQLASLDLSTATGLTNIDCSWNQLTTLDVSNLPDLGSLRCEINQLAAINFGETENIVDLRCNANQLTSLDLSHFDNMVHLECSSNDLQEVDVTNMPGLYMFFCGGNQLQTLDLSQSYGLKFLDCSGNQLVSIFAKNGNEEYGFDFSGNQTLQFICVDEFQVPAISNLMHNYSYSDDFWYPDHCTLSSYCSFVPGGDFFWLQGNTTVDIDNDGCNAADLAFPGLNLSVTDGTNTGHFIADNSGAYAIPVAAGVHTLTPQLENPAYFTVSPASFTIDFPAQSSPALQNLCVSFNGPHQDLEVVVVPVGPARPGFDCHYKIIYKNKGTTAESGTIAFLFEGGSMDFVSAIPAQNSQTANTVTWDYTDLQPFETRVIEVTLNANSPAETPAVNIGDQLNFGVTIQDVASDETPADNEFGFKQFVVGALDPNDKTCLEGQSVGPEIAGNYMHYVIRFENTGNYPAQNVVVKDYIDTTKFDIHSLVPMASSHSMVTRISGQNLVEFVFEDINLPFDDMANDGYVAFKIKTLPTIGLGSILSNTASIFFDYNLPVVTNTATTTVQLLGNQDFEFSDYFTLYPNPAVSALHIGSRQNAALKAVSVYNAAGQLVMTVIEPGSEIDVSSLAGGIYFLKTMTADGSGIGTFIKQ